MLSSILPLPFCARGTGEQRSPLNADVINAAIDNELVDSMLEK